MSEGSRSERFLRYSGIVNPEHLRKARVLIVGVGAIGRQVALQLAAMGVEEIEIVDFDIVEEANMGAQGYKPCDLQVPKVIAMAAEMESFNDDLDVGVFDEKFHHYANREIEDFDPTAIFACVDCMDARTEIARKAIELGCPLFDARMSGLVMQVYAVDMQSDTDFYKYGTTLFSNEDAHPEPCTARSVLFTSNIVAGLLVSLWAQSLKGPLPYPYLSMSLVDYTIEPIRLQCPDVVPATLMASAPQAPAPESSEDTVAEEPLVATESDPGSS